MDLNLVWAALAGAVLGSLADWLFAGVLFHDRYQLHPETWRRGAQERGRIAAAQALGAAHRRGLRRCWPPSSTRPTLRGALKLAAMIWLIGPLPLARSPTRLFIKIDHLVTASHAAGWLAKLLLIGAATAWLCL